MTPEILPSLYTSRKISVITIYNTGNVNLLRTQCLELSRGPLFKTVMRRKQYKVEAAGEREKLSKSNEEQFNPDLSDEDGVDVFCSMVRGSVHASSVGAISSLCCFVVGVWERVRHVRSRLTLASDWLLVGVCGRELEERGERREEIGDGCL